MKNDAELLPQPRALSTRYLLSPFHYRLLAFLRSCRYLPHMKLESNWINTTAEIPPTLMVVEAETVRGVVPVRFRGLDRWETLDGKQTEAPIRWRFIPCEPSSTGHFMR